MSQTRKIVRLRDGPHGIRELALVEGPALKLLGQLGVGNGRGVRRETGPRRNSGRDAQGDVVLVHRLRPKLRQLNPGLPDDAIEQAVEKLVADRSAMDPVRANREIYDLLRDGAKVTMTDADGAEVVEAVRFVHWTTPSANDWLAASQVWVTGPLHKRRTDIVCFVNGIPSGVLGTVRPRTRSSRTPTRTTYATTGTPSRSCSGLTRCGPL